jgi:hypothetical protein
VPWPPRLRHADGHLRQNPPPPQSPSPHHQISTPKKSQAEKNKSSSLPRQVAKRLHG